MAKSIGSLSRVNRLILGGNEIGGISSVYTLHHWSSSASIEGCKQYATQIGAPVDGPNPRPNGHQHHHQQHSYHKARLLVIKAQESAVNFFLRYFAVERIQGDGNDDDNTNEPTEIIVGHGGDTLETKKPNSARRTEEKAEIKRKKLTRSEFVIGDHIPNLPDHHWSTIVKFIFWRWLTWANAFELLLIVFLFCGCVHQCFELLQDYYNYPTYVSVTKTTNEDFRRDLPAVTLCNNNRMSRTTIRRNFPQLNYTHFRAMSFGTFYSVNNFTLSEDVLRRLGANETDTSSDVVDDSLGTEIDERMPDDYLINWVKVARHFSNRSLAKFHKFYPDYDLIKTLTCANIWGDPMPCENLKRIESIQQGLCVTLFHDSVFWDSRDPAVRQLEKAISSIPASIAPAANDEDDDDQENRDGIPLIVRKTGIDSKASQTKHDDDWRVGEDEEGGSGDDQGSETTQMGNMEMIRLKLDFRGHDYAVGRSLKGGVMAIHSNSMIANLNHIMHIIEPGFWYSYYIDRTDYNRLPPPYDTNCYDYQENRYFYIDKRRWNNENKVHVMNLIRKQAAKPDELQPEYVQNLRQRSLSGRECMHICSAELPASKCNCWPRGIPYLRDNNLDISGTMHYCDHGTLMKLPNASQVDGDDLYYQLCAKDFTLTCVAACPDECNFSSFDVTEQARNWPSHESRRYITDQGLLASLKEEAECCATVSVIYAGPTSSYHVTEPKYTRQDIVTIVSGNIEAWVGLSAVHAYLFLEQFYDALVEAQLISPPSVSIGAVVAGHTRRLLGPLISILTKLKVEMRQLFTYLFHQLARLFWLRTNNPGHL